MLKNIIKNKNVRLFKVYFIYRALIPFFLKVLLVNFLFQNFSKVS